MICNRRSRTINPVDFRDADDVAPEAVRACLTRVERGDPMVAPANADDVLADDAVVALTGEGRVVGVGWRHEVADGTVVDVRVERAARRKGVGASILERLAAGQGRLLASCDGAHPRAGRFLQKRGFELAGMVLLQRWDGSVEDVPKAFRTAEVRDEDDLDTVVSLLGEASRDAWPPPPVSTETLDTRDVVRVAWVGDRPVGALAAVREHDAWAVLGCAVLPEERGRGVGRVLLTDVMTRAATEDMGVTLRVDHTDEHVREITRSLGFWTCRSWAYYARPSKIATSGST